MPEFPKLPPISREPISIVLLARDANATIDEWLAFADGRAGDDEVILVDDGIGLDPPPHPRLRVVAHSAPRGVGAALRTGLGEARRPLIFYTLCDPHYRPLILETFLDRTMPESGDAEIDHLHLLSGYRAGVRVPGALRAIGWVWRMGLRVVFSIPSAPLPGWLGWRRHLAGLAARVFLGVRHGDSACPARLLRRDILPRIPIQSDGPMAHVELIAKANFLGCILGEEVALALDPGPYNGDAGAIYREAKRVFDHPDFGPAVLPGPGLGNVEATTCPPSP
jgi:hypothetical protein